MKTRIVETQTRRGRPEYYLRHLDEPSDFEFVADWLRRKKRACRLLHADGLDQRYWDFWVGGIQGGRLVLHYDTIGGTSLYATGRRNSRVLRELRYELEQLDSVTGNNEQSA
jgi:hypothetical protein